MANVKRGHDVWWRWMKEFDESLDWFRVLDYKRIKLIINRVISVKILFVTWIVLTFQKGTLEKTQFKIMQYFSMHQWQDYLFSQNHGKCVYLVVLQDQYNSYSLLPLPLYVLSGCSWCMIGNIWYSIYRRSTVHHRHHVSCTVLCKVSSIYICHGPWLLSSFKQPVDILTPLAYHTV